MLLSTSVMIVPSAPAFDVEKVTEKMSALIATAKSDMAKPGYDYDALINKLMHAQTNMNALFNNLIGGVNMMARKSAGKAQLDSKKSSK